MQRWITEGWNPKGPLKDPQGLKKSPKMIRNYKVFFLLHQNVTMPYNSFPCRNGSVQIDSRRLEPLGPLSSPHKQVTPGLCVVSDTPCSALHECDLGERSRAAAPKGTKSCRTQGDFCLFVSISVHP